VKRDVTLREAVLHHALHCDRDVVGVGRQASTSPTSRTLQAYAASRSGGIDAVWAAEDLSLLVAEYRDP
jgi:hypothetical protein